MKILHAGTKPSTIRMACALLLVCLCTALAVPRALAEPGTIRNPNGGSYVNVREWPSYDAGILAQVSVGTIVDITGTTGTWHTVWVNGVTGYIHSNFVSMATSGGGSGGGGGAGPVGTVVSGPLNVREAPSMRARVITQIPEGLRVTVLEDLGTWAHIQAAQVTGYAVKSYMHIEGGGAPAPSVNTPGANATIRTQNGGGLNLRSWASASAPILGSYANGSRVRVLTQGASWCRVQAGTESGYMSTRYLALDGGGSGSGYDAVVNNPGAGQVLNLRAEPSASSASLGQYVNGTSLKVLGVGTEWHRVRVGAAEGYMMARYVRLLNPGATPHKTVQGGDGGFVNLRSGAGYGYSVLMRVSNGSAASVVIPYTVWSEVLVRQGSGYVRGFMMSSFLK